MKDSVFGSIRLQFRVVWALVLREMTTRYGRENIGFLWIVGEPILFCAGVTIVWTAMRPSHEHGLPVTAIVVTGYVPLTMWRHAIMRAVKAYESNGSLLFHRQVTPIDIITARVALEIAGSIMAGFIVVCGAVLLGFMDPPANFGLVYLGLIYQAFFAYACALIIASLSEVSDLVEKGIGIFSYLSIPFSGAFTMVDWVPQKMQWILLWSPSVNNVEMIRGGQFGPTSRPIYDLMYDTWMTALLIAIGFALTLRVRRYLLIQ